MQNYTFVLDTNKRPLDPLHPAMARKLLSNGEAAVFRRYSFTEKLGLKPPPSRTAFDSDSRGARSSESTVLIFLDTKEPFNHCILKV